MKLVLSSFLTDNLPNSFSEAMGKPLFQSKCMIILNAVDLKNDERRKFVDDLIVKTFHDFQEVKRLDLREFVGANSDLQRAIADTDLLWIIGGDLFYLNYLIVKSGLKDVLMKKIENGEHFVCGGDSAGAIVFGPTLEKFELADDLSKAPEVFYEGMGLTNFVVVPHQDNEKYGPVVLKIKEMLQRKGFKIVGIGDNESMVIDSGELKIDKSNLK